MLFVRDLPTVSGDDGQPRFQMRLADRKIVTVLLRCPDDARTEQELLYLAWEYGWPLTTVYHLASGYLGLLYWTQDPICQKDGNLYLEDWCLLSTGATQNLAPGACINLDAEYVFVSDDPIAELPTMAIEQWVAKDRAEKAIVAASVARVAEATPQKPRLYYEDISTLQLGESRPDLVDGLLDAGGLSTWLGAPKGGKTANLVYLAYAVASGTEFHGHQAHAGLVVYIAAEGGNSTRKRFMAIRAHHGLKAQGIPLRIVPCPVDLGQKQGDTYHVVKLIQDAETDAGRKAVLVVIDTLARATPGMDENDAQGMGMFIANMDFIRTQTGAHVAVVHHFGKDKTKGGRGSSAMPAALDSEFEVADFVITNTNQRDREKASPLGFELLPVAIGRQAEGQEVVSVVAIPASSSAKNAFAPKKVPPGALNAFATLQDLAMNGRSVPLSEWRTEFVARHYPENAKTGATQFRRSKATLQNVARLTVEGDNYAPRD